MTTERARHAPHETRVPVPCSSIPLDFQMGEWRVQPGLGRLGRDGREIRLRPQLMDVLCCLATRAGHTVGRGEIFSTVWPGQFVAETGLPRCIAELRRVFHDDAREPTVIETIPKRGYRLLPPVAWAQHGDAPVQAGRGPARGNRADRNDREGPTREARLYAAPNVVTLESAVDDLADGRQVIGSAETRAQAVRPCGEGASGSRGLGTWSTSGGAAAGSGSRWRWRRMSAWLTGTAVAIRSFVR